MTLGVFLFGLFSLINGEMPIYGFQHQNGTFVESCEFTLCLESSQYIVKWNGIINTINKDNVRLIFNIECISDNYVNINDYLLIKYRFSNNEFTQIDLTKLIGKSVDKQLTNIVNAQTYVEIELQCIGCNKTENRTFCMENAYLEISETKHPTTFPTQTPTSISPTKYTMTPSIAPTENITSTDPSDDEKDGAVSKTLLSVLIMMVVLTTALTVMALIYKRIRENAKSDDDLDTKVVTHVIVKPTHTHDVPKIHHPHSHPHSHSHNKKKKSAVILPNGHENETEQRLVNENQG